MTVLPVGRSRERLAAVAEHVRAVDGSPGEFHAADPTSLANVRAIAELLAAHEQVHAREQYGAP